MTDQDLNNLLWRAQNGDHEAFGLIYDEYSVRIYKFIFVRTGHKEIAEDLLSDTFIKAWLKISQVSSSKSLSSWLYQVAKNNVIDHYRSKKQTVSLDDAGELEDIVNLVEEASLNFDQKRILDTLDQLPKDQAVVIRYKFFEDLSNEEVAAIMNKTEVAVRVLQHRAIAKLKNLLNK